jgi:hypothetical protein
MIEAQLSTLAEMKCPGEGMKTTADISEFQADAAGAEERKERKQTTRKRRQSPRV